MNLNYVVDVNLLNNSLISNQSGISLSGSPNTSYYRINIRYNIFQMKTNNAISLQVQNGIGHNVNIYSNNLFGAGIQNSGAYDVSIKKNNIIINNPKNNGISIGNLGGPFKCSLF